MLGICSFRAVGHAIFLTDKRSDFTPIELFLHADTLEQGKEPATGTWSAYFANPTINLFSHAPGFDSLRFTDNMKKVFKHGKLENSDTASDERRLLLAYKNNK